MRQYLYTLTQEDGTLTANQVVKKKFNFSSRLRTKIKNRGTVYVNDQLIPMWTPLSCGDSIKVILPDETSDFPPEDVPINPVYEDDDLLIMDKPYGYVVHPTKGHKSQTIANGLMKYMMDSNQSFKIRFVNRLDMDTSGLLIVAKNSHAQGELVKQMNQNRVLKEYLAIVEGSIGKDVDIIDLPIGHPNPELPHRGVTEAGKPSITRYRVLKRLGANYTLVSLILETGRTHQIRVHMSHIGHPLVGDHLYGATMETQIKRQALHASRLEFFHPVSLEPISITSPMPDDMMDFIAGLP